MNRPNTVLDGLSLIVGLSVAIIGLLNVVPTFGVLPQIGPFPIDWFRPTFFSISALAVVLSLIELSHPASALKWLNLAILLLCLPIIAFASYDYFVVGKKMLNFVFLFKSKEAVIASAAAFVSIYLCWRVWGGAIAILGILSFAYLSTGQYWPGVLATAANNSVETIAHNIWYSSDQGILGNIMGVVLSTVLPFIILGAILDCCGAGRSMIRISFRLMRRFKGGPAYAAISASALFGTVSGSSVANVVGTGVVTIPMIKRRGFSSNFAGAVEAAASTGGQILPPIMGAGALVMADLVGVSYLTVITAAIVPGIAYYASLFLSVYFKSGSLNLSAGTDLDSDLDISVQDFVNLSLVFLPLGLIVWLLMGGSSPAGASIAAIFALIPSSFIVPEIRRNPMILVRGLAQGGRTVAQLAVALAVVGMVVATLSATGIPTKFAILLSSASETSLFLALLVTAIGCVVLGMGMPTLPAYIAIVVVMGPTLQKFGLDLLVIHFFVFFFGVASVITPPVAIAAYAGAAIAKGKPLATSLISSQIGAMIFLIPFAFAFHPELLNVSTGVNGAPAGSLWLSLIFLAASLYICSSALIGYDRAPLSMMERLVRIIATVLLIGPGLTNNTIGLAIGIAAIVWHVVLKEKNQAQKSPR